jgi:hypothetical protein
MPKGALLAVMVAAIYLLLRGAGIINDANFVVWAQASPMLARNVMRSADRERDMPEEYREPPRVHPASGTAASE